MAKSGRELKDFFLLFFVVTVVMAMCGFAIFGYGASHPNFASFEKSFYTTLGIAFGHVDHETVVGESFGLDKGKANFFYWVLMFVMFLMLNIALAIILDAFEKNQDDRRSMDKPFIELFTLQPIRSCFSYCKNRNKKNPAIKSKNSVNDLGILAYFFANTRKTAAISKKILESEAAENLFNIERRKSIIGGIPHEYTNEEIETILSNIKLDKEGLKEKIGTILDNAEEVEKTTNLLFEYYGKDGKERMAFEYQLRDIQSHVTKSLKGTDMKIEQMQVQMDRKIEQMQVQMDRKIERTEQKLDLILKHLKSKVG